MGLLVIKRKRQFGKGYSNCLKVIIDEKHVIEIANGETKQIELAEGTHSVKLSYYFKLPIPLLDNLEINCNHQENVYLEETTKYTVSIGANQFEIEHDGNTKKTTVDHNSKSTRLANLSKNSWGLLIALFLSIGILEIGIFLIDDYLLSCLSIFLHTMILVVVPSYINFFKVFLYKGESGEESEKLISNYKNCFKSGLITLGFLTIITLVISLLFAEMLIFYLIISSSAFLILECIVLTNKFNISFLKVAAIITIVVTLISAIVAYAPKADKSCGHPACEENGPFPCYGKNNTCPNYTDCYQDLFCDECD